MLLLMTVKFFRKCVTHHWQTYRNEIPDLSINIDFKFVMWYYKGNKDFTTKKDGLFGVGAVAPPQIDHIIPIQFHLLHRFSKPNTSTTQHLLIGRTIFYNHYISHTNVQFFIISNTKTFNITCQIIRSCSLHKLFY